LDNPVARRDDQPAVDPLQQTYVVGDALRGVHARDTRALDDSYTVAAAPTRVQGAVEFQTRDRDAPPVRGDSQIDATMEMFDGHAVPGDRLVAETRCTTERRITAWLRRRRRSAQQFDRGAGNPRVEHRVVPEVDEWSVAPVRGHKRVTALEDADLVAIEHAVQILVIQICLQREHGPATGAPIAVLRDRVHLLRLPAIGAQVPERGAIRCTLVRPEVLHPCPRQQRDPAVLQLLDRTDAIKGIR
jgi:hypothetical protein